MAKREDKKPVERKIGKQQQTKKGLIDPRYKNVIYTGIFIVVCIIFFIINNTRNEPENGPYPPNYKSKVE